MNETFISYSRRDWDFAEKIINALKTYGIDPWYDQEDIPAAIPWKAEMLLGVQCSQSFVYLISPDSIVSQACQQELDCALRHNKRIVPLVARSPGATPIHPAISELNWIFFNNKFDTGLEKLIQIIENPDSYNQILNNKQQFFLDIYQQERVEKSIPLLRNKYLIGRHPTPDLLICGAISIPDSSRLISRAHLELNWVDGERGWKYRDLSRNGIGTFPKTLPDKILKHSTRLFLTPEIYMLFKAFDPENIDEIDDHPTVGID